MIVHRPGTRARIFIPNFEIQSVKPAENPDDIAKGINGWVVMVNGHEIPTADTLEELEAQQR